MTDKRTLENPVYVAAAIVASAILAAISHPVSFSNSSIGWTAVTVCAMSFVTTGISLIRLSRKVAQFSLNVRSNWIVCIFLIFIAGAFTDPLNKDHLPGRPVGPGMVSNVKTTSNGDFWVSVLTIDGTQRIVCSKATVRKFGIKTGGKIEGLYYQRTFIQLKVDGRMLQSAEMAVNAINQRDGYAWMLIGAILAGTIFLWCWNYFASV